jgi:hypothetical protein
VRRRRWSELAPGARVGVGVGAVAQFALLGAALADLRRREPGELTAPRWVWGLVCLVNVVGPLTYFAVGRRRGAAVGQDSLR